MYILFDKHFLHTHVSLFLRYTFAAERWLSVETSVDVEVKGTSPDNSVDFESRFFFQTRDRLSESHMWISILYRPQTSTFTRVQRVSCALVYILLTMIANAMYFNPENEYESAPLLKAGPFRFTLQQVIVFEQCSVKRKPNPLPDDKILDWSKLRPIADNILKCI